MMDGRVVGAIQVMFTQDGPGDNRWPALDGRGGLPSQKSWLDDSLQ